MKIFIHHVWYKKYNKNSNGIIKRKEKIQQYNVGMVGLSWVVTSSTKVYTTASSHVKSTQQSLCMNFVRRRSSATLGIALDTDSQ